MWYGVSLGSTRFPQTRQRLEARSISPPSTVASVVVLGSSLALMSCRACERNSSNSCSRCATFVPPASRGSPPHARDLHGQSELTEYTLPCLNRTLLDVPD